MVLASGDLLEAVRSGWLTFSKLLQYNVGDGIRVKFLEACVVWGLYSQRHFSRSLLS